MNNVAGQIKLRGPGKSQSCYNGEEELTCGNKHKHISRSARKTTLYVLYTYQCNNAMNTLQFSFQNNGDELLPATRQMKVSTANPAAAVWKGKLNR